MKRIFPILLLFCLAYTVATSQTITITATSVEVVSSGAKTRAFYAIDDVFFINTAAGGFTAKDASNGTILFNGDTSEVTISPYTLWADKFDFLEGVCNRIPYAGNAPYTLLPNRGVNYLYKNGAGTVTVLNSRTKYTLWTGSYENLVGGETASNTLNWIRTKLFQSQTRAMAGIGPYWSAQVDTSAGTTSNIEVLGRGPVGSIYVLTGSSCKTTGVIAKITLPYTSDELMPCLTPSNANAAAHISRVYVQPEGDGVFSIRASGTALADETEYTWTVFIGVVNSTPEN